MRTFDSGGNLDFAEYDKKMFVCLPHQNSRKECNITEMSVYRIPDLLSKL